MLLGLDDAFEGAERVGAYELSRWNWVRLLPAPTWRWRWPWRVAGEHQADLRDGW